LEVIKFLSRINRLGNAVTRKLEETTIREEILFNANCHFCWFRLSGTINNLFRNGEIDQFDNLLLGAGRVVISTKMTAVDSSYIGKTTYEDSFTDHFFDDLKDWIKEKTISDCYLDIDDITGEEALFSCSVLELAERMTVHKSARELLGA